MLNKKVSLILIVSIVLAALFVCMPYANELVSGSDSVSTDYEDSADEMGQIISDDNVTCTLFSDGTVRIDEVPEGYVESGKVLNVPSEIVCGSATYKVTEVGSTAFKVLSITGIFIPNTIVKIDDYTPTTGDSIVCYGNGAFGGNGSISLEFESGSNLEYIGAFAFYDCTISEITLPASVEHVGDFAFNKLSELVISDGSELETVGNGSFSSLGQSTVIYLPDSLVSIGAANPFGNASVTFNDNFVYEGGVIYSKDCKTVYSYCGSDSTVTIKDTVEKISKGAFLGTDVVSVTIPDSVKAIEDYAFANCLSLETVSFTKDSGIETIGNYAFAIGWDESGMASSLSQFGWTNNCITMPCSIKSVGDYAFAELNNLGTLKHMQANIASSISNSNVTMVIFEDENSTGSITTSDLEYVGYYAFYNFSNLESVQFGNSSSSVNGVVIAEGAFAHVKSTTNSYNTEANSIAEVVFDPSKFKLQSIGDCAFGTVDDAGYKDYKNVTVHFAQFGNVYGEIVIPSTVESIGVAAFSSYRYATGVTSNVYSNELITKLSFLEDSQITEIGDGAFAKMSLKEGIDLSNCTCLESIGKVAFSGSSAMTGSILLPEGLKEIGEKAFYLKAPVSTSIVSIPSSVEYVGNQAFGGGISSSSSAKGINITCNSCVISFGGDNPFGIESISSKILTGTNDCTLISIGSEITVIDADILASSSVSSITVSEDNSIFSVDDGILYMVSEGTKTVLKAVDQVTSFEITDDTNVVGSYAFYGCNELKTVDLTGSSVTVSEYAFLNCSELRSVIVSDVDDISTSAFSGTSGLYIYEPLNSNLDEEALSVFGTYGGKTNVVDEVVFVVPNIASQTVILTDSSYSDGVFSFKLDITGGYTGYDVNVELQDGSEVVCDAYGVYSISLSHDEIVTISAKDRVSADKFTVTLHANGGVFNDGSETVVMYIPEGMSILDSDIQIPTRNLSSIDSWYTDESCTQIFNILSEPVSGNIDLWCKWVSAEPCITFNSEYGTISAILSQSAFSSGDRSAESVTYEFTPYDGYEFVDWVVTPFGSDSVEYDTSSLSYVATNDTYITVEVRYYSGTNLTDVTVTDVTSDLTQLVLQWKVGGYVDTSMSTWTGLSSTPVIVDDYVYMRVSDKLYKVEIDTGYIVKYVDSATSTEYYHYIGYGDGMILDYQTHIVYDLDLNPLYNMPSSVTSVTYYNGYFYGPTSDGKVVRFTATDNDPSTVETKMVDENWGSDYTWFGMYGQSSAPIFVDDYIYYISCSGDDRDLVSVSLTNSSVKVLDLTSIRGHMLDDGWLTYYDGKIYLTSYTVGLFGTMSTTGYSTITSVSVNNGVFGSPTYTSVKLNIDGSVTYFQSMLSQFVIYNGRGYLNISGTPGEESYLAVYDVDTMDVLYYCLSERSHGSIVLNVADVDETGEIFIYLLPYSSNEYLYLFCDDGTEIIPDTGEISLGTYNSQAVRSGPDGQLLWYNDDGWVRCYTVADENPYYFLIQDGEMARWVVGYGSTTAEALSSTGYATLSDGVLLGANLYDSLEDYEGWNVYALSSGSCDDKDYKPYEYSWYCVDNNNLLDSSFVYTHYWIITTSDTLNVEGASWKYGDGNTYLFADNVGDDKDIVGVLLSVTGDVTYTVSGTISNHTGEGISGAFVSLGEGFDCTTSSDGCYRISGVSSGQYTITVTLSGYCEYTADMSVSAENVVKDVEMSMLYIVSSDNTVNGSFSVSCESAVQGAVVVVSPKPDSSYEIASIYYVDSSGDSVTISYSEDGYSFSMPASNVTIHVTFEKMSSYNISGTASSSDGKVTIDLTVLRTTGSSDIDNAYFLVITQYENGIFVNVYSKVGLENGSAAERIAVSSSGLVSVSVQMVSGISSGVYDIYGQYSYIVSIEV